jgi:hypothetical protein
MPAATEAARSVCCGATVTTRSPPVSPTNVAGTGCAATLREFSVSRSTTVPLARETSRLPTIVSLWSSPMTSLSVSEAGIVDRSRSERIAPRISPTLRKRLIGSFCSARTTMSLTAAGSDGVSIRSDSGSCCITL